uniref:Uncharacterized protein n=1 Tax=Romanomermis culicivorax TaxID=13658 RepID=A0A915IKS2_ROMCU
MLTTAFLSMWMSNVAATAMMVPIVLSMLDELIAHHKRSELPVVTSDSDMVKIYSAAEFRNRISSSAGLVTSDTETESKANESYVDSGVGFDIDIQEIKENLASNDPTFNEMSVQTDDLAVISPGHMAHLHKELNKMPTEISGLCKAVLLSICYAANLGGTGTLTGTGPNIVLTNTLNDEYANQNRITFASWMVFAVPAMLVCLVLAWFWLLIMFLGSRSLLNMFSWKQSKNDGISELFQHKYQELGKMSFAEKSVLFWFVVLVFLWVSRKPTFMRGWQDVFHLDGFTSDACPAMLIACVLFVWPTQMPDFLFWRQNSASKPQRHSSLMTWAAMQKKFSWSIIILLGGGYAMAKGIEVSGLQNRIGCLMRHFVSDLDQIVIVIVVVIMISVITVVASNSATASIFLPVLVSLFGSLL